MLQYCLDELQMSVINLCFVNANIVAPEKQKIMVLFKL